MGQCIQQQVVGQLAQTESVVFGAAAAAALEEPQELYTTDGSPLRNALRTYLKTYNGVVERREEVV